METELEPDIWVTRGGEEEELPVMSGNLTLSYSEPCEFTFELDNSSGDYEQDEELADVREPEPEYLLLNIQTGEDTWPDCPDLRVKNYRSGPDDTVTVSGRCRLCELDKNDQAIVVDGISTVEGETAANLVDMIVAAYGLTATGVPDRVIPTFDLVGNPLEWLGEMLPDYVFRMGSGNQVVFSLYTSHASGPHLEDEEHLEVLDFVRSDDIYNKATVERVVPTSGEVELLNVQQSWDAHPSPSVLEFTLDQPSRQFSFRILKGYRGKLQEMVLLDESGDPITGPGPFTNPSYTGTVPVYSFTVDYVPGIDAGDLGPYKPNIEILVTGLPLAVDPVPVDGYSATATAGAGDRPYPEAFSLVVVPDQTAAMSVAEAKVEKGLRDGSLLGLETRILANKIPIANGGATVTDAKKKFTAKPVIAESIRLSFDRSGDTGTMAVETTFMET